MTYYLKSWSIYFITSKLGPTANADCLLSVAHAVKRKRVEKLTPISDDKGSLLRRQPELHDVKTKKGPRCPDKVAGYTLTLFAISLPHICHKGICYAASFSSWSAQASIHNVMQAERTVKQTCLWNILTPKSSCICLHAVEPSGYAVQCALVWIGISTTASDPQQISELDCI